MIDRETLAPWVGEGIDALATVDFRLHGLIRALYLAARGAGAPLSLQAARFLRDRVRQGAEVIVCVGFPVYPVFIGETDGICGAVVLAHALRVGLGARPVLVTEEAIAPFVAAALGAAGMPPVIGLDAAGGADTSARVVPCPPGADPGRECSLALLRRQPAAVLAVEKAGVNRAGVPHSSGGMDLSQATAYLEELFRGAGRLGAPTVGIGDQGNELGLGAIAQAADAAAAYGRKCRCPCGQGTTSGVPAQVTVIGGTSDWGAFGVAAALAFLVDRPQALPDGAAIRAIIAAESAAGALDAATRTPIPQVDGYPADFCAQLVEMMRQGIALPARFADLEPERYRAGLDRLRAVAPSGAET